MDSGLFQRGPKAEIALAKPWKKNLGAFCLFSANASFSLISKLQAGKWYKSPFLFFPVHQHGQVKSAKNQSQYEHAHNDICRISLHYCRNIPCSKCVCLCMHHIFMSEWTSSTGRDPFKVEVFTHSNKDNQQSPTLLRCLQHSLKIIKMQ